MLILFLTYNRLENIVHLKNILIVLLFIQIREMQIIFDRIAYCFASGFVRFGYLTMKTVQFLKKMNLNVFRKTKRLVCCFSNLRKMTIDLCKIRNKRQREMF